MEVSDADTVALAPSATSSVEYEPRPLKYTPDHWSEPGPAATSGFVLPALPFQRINSRHRLAGREESRAGQKAAGGGLAGGRGVGSLPLLRHSSSPRTGTIPDGGALSTQGKGSELHRLRGSPCSCTPDTAPPRCPSESPSGGWRLYFFELMTEVDPSRFASVVRRTLRCIDATLHGYGERQPLDTTAANRVSVCTSGHQ